MWSNCLLDPGTDFLVGNMVFVWPNLPEAPSLCKVQTWSSKPCPSQTGSMTTEHLLQAMPMANLQRHFRPLETQAVKKLFSDLGDLPCMAAFVQRVSTFLNSIILSTKLGHLRTNLYVESQSFHLSERQEELYTQKN